MKIILLFLFSSLFYVSGKTHEPSSIRDTDLSPDNQQIVYTVSAPTDRQPQQTIWIARADGTDAHPLVTGHSSHWSPDGEWIAYLKDTTLCLMRPTGEQSRILPEHKIKNFYWAPDSTRIAFIATAPNETPLAPRVITGPVCNSIRDAAGSTQLWLVDLEGNEQQVTDTKLFLDPTQCSWAPDGNTIATRCRPTPYFNDFPRSTLQLIDVHTGAMTPLVQGMVDPQSPFFSSDGTRVGFIASDEELPWAFASRVHWISLPLADLHALTPTPDQGLQYKKSGGLLGWSADNQALYAMEMAGTLSALYRIPINGDPVEPVRTNWVITSPRLSADRTKIACTVQNLTHPPEAAIIDMDSGTLTIVSAHNQAVDPTLIGTTEKIQWPSYDRTMIEGLLTYPPNYDPNRSYPTIVMIHGGPGGVWGQHFLRSAYPNVHPVQALTEAGFVIFQPNVRGSQGYGRQFRFSNFADWGGKDFEDMMAGVDYVIAQGVADPNRLGVMGWSYGGYLTAWAVTQTDRFRAAAVGAPITDLISAIGTSDIPDLIPSFFETEVWTNPLPLIERSPLYQVGSVTTPTLLLHGTADRRCPSGQSCEFYTQLQRRGITTELVLYPNSQHLPDSRYRSDLRQRHVAWFSKYLKDAGLEEGQTP